MCVLLTEAGLVLAMLSAAAAPVPATVNVTIAEDPDLGGPLAVNGVEISENEIKRIVIYGNCRPAMEYRRINALIDWDLALRAAEGQDMSRYEITDEAFQKHFDKKIAEFVERFPMLETETEVRRAYRDFEWYKRELRQEMLVDQVFLTDDPALWPDVTFEALRQEAGEILINDFKESYERRLGFTAEARAEWQAKKDAGEDPGPYPDMYPEDSMYRSILRQIVRDAYFDSVETKTAKDGLPDDLIITMDFDFDGDPELLITTDEMWETVKSTVTPKEISDARLFLSLIEAVRQRLATEGKLISEEEAQLALEEISAGFTSGMFDLGQIAVGGHQFPSIESYAAFFPLFESYKRAIEPTLETEDGSLAPELREHLDQANKVMGLAETDAEVLLVSAFDFANFAWKENGWEWAEQQAAFLKGQVDENLAAWADWQKKELQSGAAAGNGAEGAEDGVEPADGEQGAEAAAPPLDPNVFWALLMDDYCEFWDPPQPVTGRPGSAIGYKQKGRFGARTRNDTRSLLAESPYSHFLYGGLLTDQVFFEQPIGGIEGPFVGPYGYYLTKVISRTPPSRPLNVRDERHLELLREDWIRDSFAWYAHAALDQAETVGLPR